MLNKSDVGVLKRGVRVKVGGRCGSVFNAHEPEWIDHKTRAFRKELQGADISFDVGLLRIDVCGMLQCKDFCEVVSLEDADGNIHDAEIFYCDYEPT